MKLNHSVHVPANIEDVWRFLDDTHAVAACMPGAELTETIDRDNYRGQVKISIGPLTMNYSGDITVSERDNSSHRMELSAAGRDRRGSGTARAIVHLTLEPDGDETQMKVVSDLQLTGRIASLGRGINDVSNKLFAEFADNLVAELDGQQTGALSSTSKTSETGSSRPRHEVKTDKPSGGSHQSVTGIPTDGTLKLGPLVWSVLRERIANFLQNVSDRIRPNK